MQPLWANSTGRDHQNMRNILCLCKTKDLSKLCFLTLDSVHKILLISSDVQVLNNDIEGGDRRSFDHSSLFETADTGLFMKKKKKQLRRKINLHNTVTYIQKKKTCYPQSEAQDNPFFSADC